MFLVICLSSDEGSIWEVMKLDSVQAETKDSVQAAMKPDSV